MTCPTTPRKRKVNSVFCVNFNMPSLDFTKDVAKPLASIIKPFMLTWLRHYLLDNSLFFGIINLTSKMSYLGDHCHGRLCRFKTRCPWPKWHIECSSGACYRRSFFRERILRSPRSGASQIRDVKTGPARWAVGFNSSKGIRFFLVFHITRYNMPTTDKD